MSDWYKCYPRKLLDACEDLKDLTLVGVYRTVLDRIYENDGPISNEPTSIGRYCGIGGTKCARAIAELLERRKLFLTDDGKLMNPRAVDELAKRAEVTEARSRAGSAPRKSTRNERETDEKRTSDARPTSVPRSSHGGFAEVSDDYLAENGQSSGTYVQTRARERENRKKESPQPPKGPIDRMPDFDDSPLTPDQQREALARTNLANRDLPGGVDIAKLTHRIMQIAKIIAPPPDMVLVESWLAQGADPEADIIRTVERMSAHAKGSVRQFRYFDAEIRRLVEVKRTAETSNITKFRNIAASARR
jgi:uncharacterized protein YdaU (DUF1376 family)